MAAQKKTAGKPRGGAKQTRGKANQKQAASGISATELIGLGLVGLAAVSLAVLITGDPATNAIKALLLGLAGVFSWLIPMLLLWIGILVGFAGKKKYDTGRILLMFVAVLLAFAMVHVFYAKEILLGMQIDSYLNFIQESFFTRKGTGALGALLAYPAYSLLGNQWTGLIALFFLFAGCVVWIKQISQRRLGEQARERFETGRAEYRQRREERAAEQEQARAQRKEQLQILRRDHLVHNVPGEEGREQAGQYDHRLQHQRHHDRAPVGLNHPAQSLDDVHRRPPFVAAKARLIEAAFKKEET